MYYQFGSMAVFNLQRFDYDSSCCLQQSTYNSGGLFLSMYFLPNFKSLTICLVPHALKMPLELPWAYFPSCLSTYAILSCSVQIVLPQHKSSSFLSFPISLYSPPIRPHAFKTTVTIKIDKDTYIMMTLSLHSNDNATLEIVRLCHFCWKGNLQDKVAILLLLQRHL